MNLITLACEALALWSLGRIGYWRAFPLFYAKLVVVTVAYSLQNPLSERWWDQWWAPFQVVIVLLMLGSAMEAFRRLVQELPRPESRILAVAVGLVGYVVAVVFLLGHWSSDPTVFMSKVSFAAEASLTVAMTPMIAYQWLSPFRSSRTAEVHFWLLTVLNLSCWAVDVLFRIMPKDNELEWNVAHGMFTCAYCVLLLLWAFEVPRIIRDDASSRPASPAHPAQVN